MTPAAAPSRPSLTPAVIGIALAGALILVLGFWTARRPVRVGHPQVDLLQPGRDTTVSGPLTLVFRSSQRLAMLPTGWGTGRHHVHVLANGVELMPAAADIRPLGNDRYAWVLAGLPDSAQLQLVWALPNHTRQAAGASRSVLVRTQP